MSDAHEAVAPPGQATGFAVDVGEVAGGIGTVAVTGAVDLLTAPSVGAALEAAQQTSRAIRLDLRGVDFLGSAGLSVLVDAERRAEGSGGTLAIVALGHTVLRAVQVTGLDAVLRIFDDAAAADEFLRA